jgi:hypothetical protein
MKKLAFAVLFASTVAFAGGYWSFSQNLSGNTDAVGYMTNAFPTLDAGISVQNLSLPLGVNGVRPIATTAQVTINAAGTNVFSGTAAFPGFMRGWRGTVNPQDGGVLWARVQSLDITLNADAGTDQNSLSFGNKTLPILQPGDMLFWSAENILQTTTADAGIGMLIELTSP